jgi:hypothetical protein
VRRSVRGVQGRRCGCGHVLAGAATADVTGPVTSGQPP